MASPVQPIKVSNWEHVRRLKLPESPADRRPALERHQLAESTMDKLSSPPLTEFRNPSDRNSTFLDARLSRFEVTSAAASGFTHHPRARRSFFCMRSSDSAKLSSYAVLHSRVVASRVCGRGRSASPSTAVVCLGCRLNSVSPHGDGAARRWGCNHSTLVSAVTKGETPPLAAEASKAASDRLMQLQKGQQSLRQITDRLCDAARAFFIEAPHDRRPPPSTNLAHASGHAEVLTLCRLRSATIPAT
jgi:hypothetical protein